MKGRFGQICLVTLALFFAFTGSTTMSASAEFQVVDGTIVGPDGRPFIGHGVNISGPNWVWEHKSAPDADLIVGCWGFNLVRVNIFLFENSKYPQVTSNNDLDAIVKAFTSRGVVVVIEAHDRTGAYYTGQDLEQLTSWYTQLARTYRDNPYVWFDVMNEPGSAGPPKRDEWINVHRTVIAAIRDIAQAQNIILVEGSTWGQDTAISTPAPVKPEQSAILSLADEVTSFGGRTYDNIVFSIHTYDMWAYPPAKLEAYVQEVKRRGLALFIGEYGSQQDDGSSTLTATRSMFEVARAEQIGRAVWHWDGGTINSLTTGKRGGGWEIDSCSAPSNLTELGRLVWEDNHSAGGTK